MPKTLCVVASHPDDEVLGCGASVRKYVDAGWRATCLLMTGGVGGRHQRNTDDQKVHEAQQILAAQTDAAGALLGFDSIERLGFPDNRMDTVSRMDISHAIREVFVRERPDLVLTHHAGDYNWDHRITFDAVLMAGRQSPGDPAPAEIWSFEVRSSTERGLSTHLPFSPTVYVDVEKTLEAKVAALEKYEAELHETPHPRSVDGIRSLAAMRGHEVGIGAAEAFVCIRRIVK